MATKILIFLDGHVGDAIVLKAPASLLEDFGRKFEEWPPEDFEIYDKDNGFWVWEGDVEKWNGSLRQLTDQEFDRLKTFGNID